ncbi:hypothetical protein AAVH_43051, partial [Aphelenchoides avenae]
LKFGSFAYSSRIDAIFTDSGNPGIAGPPKAIDALVAAASAEYDAKHDAYLARCQQGNLPDLVFTLGHDTYVVPISQLLVD